MGEMRTCVVDPHPINVYPIACDDVSKGRLGDGGGGGGGDGEEEEEEKEECSW